MLYVTTKLQCAKENESKLAEHIPRLYASGKEYVEKEQM